MATAAPAGSVRFSPPAGLWTDADLSHCLLQDLRQAASAPRNKQIPVVNHLSPTSRRLKSILQRVLKFAVCTGQFFDGDDGLLFPPFSALEVPFENELSYLTLLPSPNGKLGLILVCDNSSFLPAFVPIASDCILIVGKADQFFCLPPVFLRRPSLIGR